MPEGGFLTRAPWHSLPAMGSIPPPIRVNRSPVLTLWATVVAERLGYPPETAMTLGRFVAGSSARAKARRLGIIDEAQEAEERRAAAAELKPRTQTVRLLGRDIPVLPVADGTLRAEDDGKPASARSVQNYIARGFGDRLAEARAAMEALAADSSDRERSIRSIMNTDSGDHEHLPGSAGEGPDERHGVMAGYCHRQLSPLILSGVSSSLQSRP